MIDLNHIYHADVLDYIDMVQDEFVQCIVTSPPYFKLRDYQLQKTSWPEVKYSLFGFEITVPAMECCLGLESTPQEYIGHMVLIFRRAKRILKKNGTCWVNIGDSYHGGNTQPGGGSHNGKHIRSGTPPYKNKINDLKAKDMLGIPWMLAFALRDDGWYLRSDIIWHKRNPMPESCNDRPTKAHEYIFLLSKSPKYYYDAFAIATEYADKTLTTFGNKVRTGYGDGTGLVASENWHNQVPERKPKDWSKVPSGWDTSPEGDHGSFHKNGRRPRPDVDNKGGNQASVNGIPAMATNGTINRKGHSCYFDKDGNLIGSGKANKRTVWSVTSKSFAEAHFATFPPDLIIDCIKAGSPEGATVCDLFMGAGTTAVVSRKLGRNFTGCDLSKKYIEDIANPRLRKELGLFI